MISKEKMGKHLAEIASIWEGTEEVTGNQGFKNAVFQQKMEDVGWLKGQAWCAYFTELVWTEGYAGHFSILKRIEELFSGSAVQTFRSFSKSKEFEVSQTPAKGSVAIWQTFRQGTASWTGHAGIVVDFDSKTFTTMEGNTNSNGGREGIEVAKKIRRYNFTAQNGLRLKGFIHPSAVS